MSISTNVTVSFTAPTPQLTPTVIPSTPIPPDGQTQATITVNLSQGGVPMASKLITLTRPSGSSALINGVSVGSTSAATDANGNVSWHVTDTVNESVTFIVTF